MAEFNRILFEQQLRSDLIDDVSREIYKLTLEEWDAGWAIGPFIQDEM